MINVMTEGAKGDGVTDDTAAIQKAISTGEGVYLPAPPVKYLTTQPLTCIRPGQKFRGDGQEASQLLITSAFNMSGAGVFDATCGEQGPIVEDLGIWFTQFCNTVGREVIVRA